MRNRFKKRWEEKPLAPVLTVRTKEPFQCSWLSLLAMETGGEYRFERDERFRARNPAGSKAVSPGVVYAPGSEASSSAIRSSL
jgi:hypothetical protein